MRLRAGLVLLCFVGLSFPSFAQAKKQPPKEAKPAANLPTLTMPNSFGAKAVGQTELTLTGTNLDAVHSLWLSVGGKVEMLPAEKDGNSRKVKVEFPAGTPVGTYLMRVASKAGVSNWKMLNLDELPEVLETDKNRAKSSPQVVANGCVVVGKIDAESSDFYRISAKANVPVTIEALGRRIGSTLDPVILMHDGAGKELAGLYADDTPGLQGDARLTFTPKADGDYIIELRDSTFRGGDGFVYRLRIGQFPGVTTAFPVAVQAGQKPSLAFAGPSVKELETVTLNAKADDVALTVSPRRKSGVSGWPVDVAVTAEAQLTETEPNDDPKQANALPIPGGITAKLDRKADVDHFKIGVKKDKKYTVTTQTASINSPAEVLVKVTDAKGGKLGESNPTAPLNQIKFTGNADGDVLIACEHQNYLAGPNEVYWLTVREDLPDASVVIAADKLETAENGFAYLPITSVTRQNGYAGALEVKLVGPQNLVISEKIPASANPTLALPFYLPVKLKDGAKLGLEVVRFRVQDGDLKRWITTGDSIKNLFGGLANSPATPTTFVAVTSLPAMPYSLTATTEKQKVAVGSTIKIQVEAKRDKGFTDEIALSQLALPANVTAKLKPIAKDQNKAEVELTLAANAPIGPMQFILKGAGKSATDAVYTMPLTITVEAAPKPAEAKKPETKK
ncbi:MAG: hypothetical protein ACRC8S_07955 [Fimbriiglobus sp.]